MRKMFHKRLSFLVLSWVAVALIAIGLGFAGWFFPVWSLLLLVPVAGLAAAILGSRQLLPRLSHEGKWLVAAIAGVWLLHFTNVLVPETGFDAVWYHLPIIVKFAEAHRIFYWSAFYQSLNPLASDLLFLWGWQLAGEVGTKLVAFCLALSLAIVTYALARKVLSRNWSLVCVLMVSLFQVITWQSGSVYVDVAKAFWEVTAVWLLLERRVVPAALSLGVSLASKLFSIILWPVLIVMTAVHAGWKKTVMFAALSLVVVAPFYFFTWQQVGTPFYSAGIHGAKLSEIGGVATPVAYLTTRTVQLPLMVKELAVSRDYTTPLLLPLLALAIWQVVRKKVKLTRELWMLLGFSLAQLLVWWYLPPLSTRYALSGFITLLIFCLFHLQHFCHKYHQHQKWLYGILAVGILLTIIPRLVVTGRNLKFVLGEQTKQQYLEQFYDGNIDQKLKDWHHL